MEKFSSIFIISAIITNIVEIKAPLPIQMDLYIFAQFAMKFTWVYLCLKKLSNVFRFTLRYELTNILRSENCRRNLKSLKSLSE